MNKLTTVNNSTLLQKKLSQLVTRLQQQANPLATNRDFATLESVVSEAFKILSQFYKDLSEPIYQPKAVVKDSIPTADDFNQNFTSIGDDLNTIFSEFGNMQGVVLGNFNYIVSRLNRLQAKLKNVSSLLGDYILFSNLPTKDAFFFSDSFNNTNRIEVNSPLLTVGQCEIDQDQGIITLPVDQKALTKITITDTPVINSNSNGVIGNNQQSGAQFHGTITDILDGNADTWFEYERVVFPDDGVALTLDLTINLGSAKVINFIRINPNNFGTRTPVEIVSLDTSTDGHTLISVKDDIPIAGWIGQDEANTFSLAGSTSKYAGQGLYTFTPRKAKYIHLSLRQSTPYIIRTSTAANKYRYAIGIRDIEVSALPYKTEGELISTNYTSIDEIRKVVLLSNQNPDPSTTSLLASIDHFVSPDNGISWYQIRPRVSEGVSNIAQTVPELIDFNGTGIGAVSTSSPVYNLRYKTKLTRNKDAFTPETSGIVQEIEHVGDLFSMPLSAPFTLSLQKTAVANTIRVTDPDIGMFGNTTKRKPIAIGNGGKLVVSLPFTVLPKVRQKNYIAGKWTLTESNNIVFYINGSAWSPGLLSSTNKTYLLKRGSDSASATVEFGDGTNGAAVPDKAIVSYTIQNPYRLAPGRGEGHKALLEYPPSNDTSRDLLGYISPVEVTTTILSKGSRRNQLQPYIQHSGPTSDTTGIWKITISDLTVFQTEVEYKDGISELTGVGYYSFDFSNGILYSYTPVSDTGDTTVTYAYTPVVIIPSTGWSYDGNSVLISDDWYRTWTVSDESIPASVNYFNLSKLSVAPGTVVFSDNVSTPPASLLTEVAYVDGHSELLSVIQTSEQISALSAGTTSIPFKMKISTDPSLQVRFSRSDIFKTKKGTIGAVAADGDYYIDTGTSSSATGRIYVYLDNAQTDPGSVTYYFDDPQGTASKKYSINYSTGEVYCSSVTGSNIVATYEYTNYVLIYTVAREIPSTDWEYDSSTNSVTLKDREILKNLKIPAITEVGSVGSPKMYEVLYDHVLSTRQDIAELEPYFSPVLRDYALKIIPKSKLL